MGRKIIDLTNQTFGRLTVIKRADDYINPKGKSIIMWLCQCNCDLKSEVIVSGGHLKSENTQSCGCLQKERNYEAKKKYNTYDLNKEYGIGYTFKGEEFYFDLEDYNLIKNYCWRKDNYNYIMSRIDKNNIVYMHRIVMNCPDDMDIDHIFHINWDNRKEFLRLATESQNQMNRSLQSNNSSGVTGINWENKKWRVRIHVNDKTIHLGYFNNYNEAIQVRKEAEEKYFGEFAYKNT